MRHPASVILGLSLTLNAALALGQTTAKKRPTVRPAAVPTTVPTPPPTPEPTLTPTPDVWDKEPTSYRGVDFGTPYEEVKKKTRLNFCMPQGGKLVPKRQCLSYNSIGDISVEDFWIFRDDRLLGVVFNFKTKTAYGTLRDVFVEKYGKPHSVRTGTVTTMMNVHLENEELRWVGKSVSVELDRYASTVEDGRAYVFTNALRDQFASDAEEQKQKAKKSF